MQFIFDSLHTFFVLSFLAIVVIAPFIGIALLCAYLHEKYGFIYGLIVAVVWGALVASFIVTAITGERLF